MFLNLRSCIRVMVNGSISCPWTGVILSWAAWVRGGGNTLRVGRKRILKGVTRLCSLDSQSYLAFQEDSPLRRHSSFFKKFFESHRPSRCGGMFHGRCSVCLTDLGPRTSRALFCAFSVSVGSLPLSKPAGRGRLGPVSFPELSGLSAPLSQPVSQAS